MAEDHIFTSEFTMPTAFFQSAQAFDFCHYHYVQARIACLFSLEKAAALCSALSENSKLSFTDETATRAFATCTS